MPVQPSVRVSFQSNSSSITPPLYFAISEISEHHQCNTTFSLSFPALLTSSALYSSYVSTKLTALVPKCHPSLCDLSEFKKNNCVCILPIPSPYDFCQTENYAYSFASSEDRLKNAFILGTSLESGFESQQSYNLILSSPSPECKKSCSFPIQLRF